MADEQTGTNNLDPPTPDSVMTNQPANTPRMSIVENVYHSIPGQGTSGPGASRFYRYLNSDEEAYDRTLRVGKEWQPIDIGWLKDKDVACVRIGNKNTRVPSKKPTLEQIDADNAKILEIGIEDIHTGVITVFSEIPVNEDMRVSNPKILEFMRIRCKTGDTKYSIYLVPA